MYRKANARKMTIKKSVCLLKERYAGYDFASLSCTCFTPKKGRRRVVFVLIVLRKRMQNVKIC